MFSNNLMKNVSAKPQLTDIDEKKKAASVALKRVDQLIKSKDYKMALLETAHVKEIDATNVYALALEERIKELIAESEKKQQQVQNHKPEMPSEKPKIENNNQHLNTTKSENKPSIQLNIDPIPMQSPVIETKSQSNSTALSNNIPNSPTNIEKTVNSSKQRAKVLIIDDDVSLLSVLCMTIENGGFEVIPLSTSDEAYVLLKKLVPDIILCDINLETSTMGGFSFFEKVQQMDHLKHVPFIFLTGLSDDVLIRTGKEMGADDYLTKPIREQDLLAVIKGKTKRFGEIRKMIPQPQNKINTSPTYNNPF